MKKYTLYWFFAGLAIGAIYTSTTSSYFAGVYDLTSFIGFVAGGIPLGVIFGVIGFVIDIRQNSNESPSPIAEEDIQENRSKSQASMNEKIIIHCPRCKEKTKVPKNKELEISCPACKFQWREKT